jgi:hypothetical protein
MKQPKKIERVKFFVVQLLFVKTDQLISEMKKGDKLNGNSISKKVGTKDPKTAIDQTIEHLKQKNIYPDPEEYTLVFKSAVPITDTDICTFLNLVPDYVLPTNQ